MFQGSLEGAGLPVSVSVDQEEGVATRGELRLIAQARRPVFFLLWFLLSFCTSQLSNLELPRMAQARRPFLLLLFARCVSSDLSLPPACCAALLAFLSCVLPAEWWL